MPNNFVEGPNNKLFVSSGFDPVVLWDGVSPSIRPAGLAGPSAALTLAGSTTAGLMSGTYFAYSRFLDSHDNISNLSPISNQVTLATRTGPAITNASNSTPIIISTGSAATPAGVNARDQVTIEGVTGNTGANGTWTVGAVLNVFTYTILGSTGNGTYTGGGSFVIYKAISQASNTVPIVITSANHGLAVGISATVAVSGVQGNDAANGTFVISVSDADHFSLNGSAGSGTYTGGGVWLAGVAQINYSNLPTTTDPNVTRRQILRNTDGQAVTFYVDTTNLAETDLTTTTAFSTLSDNLLSANTSVPLFDQNGFPLANQYGVPPNWKIATAYHLGRMFAAGEVDYKQGAVIVTNNSSIVQGCGTEWTSSLANRYLNIKGSTASYLISSVDTVNQMLTLSSIYMEATNSFGVYAIRPPPAERRLIYYSQSLLPEAWPPTNTIALPDDDDEITGLMVRGSFLYILEKRNIYRFTFQTDPGRDGFAFHAASRGCINQRCWTKTEEGAFLLDEAGIYMFAGEPEPVSSTIQDIFRFSDSPFQINWDASNFFHAQAYRRQETIRWFVCLSGEYLPRHAITYDYRKKRWWIEEYPVPMGGSCSGNLNIYGGSEAGKVYSLWEEFAFLDGPDLEKGTTHGTVTSAGLTWLVDNQATFASSGLVQSPIVITDGRGNGQRRLITSVSGTRLNINQPWLILPDTTSTYQLGGAQWTYLTAPHRFADSEVEERRRVEIIWEPTTLPATTSLQIFYNRSSTPEQWSADYTSTEHGGGRVISETTDSTRSGEIVVDMTKTSGLFEQRLDWRKDLYLDGVRFVEIELAGVSNGQPMVINQMTIDGVIPKGE